MNKIPGKSLEELQSEAKALHKQVEEDIRRWNNVKPPQPIFAEFRESAAFLFDSIYYLGFKNGFKYWQANEYYKKNPAELVKFKARLESEAVFLDILNPAKARVLREFISKIK